MGDFLNTIKGKIIAILTIIALVFGIVAEGVTIYRNGEEAKTANETANNAAKLKLAEAEERAQLAEKALFDAKAAAANAETARAAADNAAKLKIAEAEKETQLAKKAAAEAETQAAVAKNSAERQQAEKEDAKAKARYDTADAQIQEWIARDITGAKQTGRLATDLTNAVLPRGLGGHGPQLAQREEAPANVDKLSPRCRTLWAQWQGVTHGAFASMGTDDCILNNTPNPRATREQAIESLKKSCAQRRQNCELIAAK